MNPKIAIITGAANGIGKGIARKFADENYILYLLDKDEDKGLEVEKEFLDHNRNVIFLKVDLTNDAEVEKAFESVFLKHNRVDVLVCNAGIQIREWAIDFPMEKFDQLMNVNLRAYYLCAKLYANYMIKNNAVGAIVCISSVNSMSYHSRRSPYNISKAAINGLVGTLGVEWGRYKIRINAVAPGYVLTELMASGIKEGIIEEENIMKVIPMKRYIRIEEISNAVFFLASEQASGITGQVLCVDGGWSKNAIPEE